MSTGEGPGQALKFVWTCCHFLSLALWKSWRKQSLPLHTSHEAFLGGPPERPLPGSVVLEGLWRWTCTYSEARPRPHFCALRCLQDFHQDLLFSLSSPSTVMIAWHSTLWCEFFYTFSGTWFRKKIKASERSPCTPLSYLPARRSWSLGGGGGGRIRCTVWLPLHWHRGPGHRVTVTLPLLWSKVMMTSAVFPVCRQHTLFLGGSGTPPLVSFRLYFLFLLFQLHWDCENWPLPYQGLLETAVGLMGWTGRRLTQGQMVVGSGQVCAAGSCPGAVSVWAGGRDGGGGRSASRR